MWADTLLIAERAHLLRLMVWGGASVMIGSALVASLRVSRQWSPLLDHFGMQTAAWGAVELILTGLRFRFIAMRDLASATRFDRLLWLDLGLDIGFLLMGFALVLLGWRAMRRLSLVGAGIGVIVQGAALLLFDAMLAGQISR
jgi:uncharacterized protein DUF6992